jgi:hypothetical protein
MIYYTNHEEHRDGVITCYLNVTTELSADFGMLMSVIFQEAYLSGLYCSRHSFHGMYTFDGEELNVCYNFFDHNIHRYEKTLERLAKYPQVKTLAGNLPPSTLAG